MPRSETLLLQLWLQYEPFFLCFRAGFKKNPDFHVNSFNGSGFVHKNANKKPLIKFINRF
jgi:hypothetical protein